MKLELSKLGANIKETQDGLIIQKSQLKGGIVSSHGDHRIAMALSIAGLIAKKKVIVKGIEAIDVTYPSFVENLKALNVSCEIKT